MSSSKKSKEVQTNKYLKKYDPYENIMNTGFLTIEESINSDTDTLNKLARTEDKGGFGYGWAKGLIMGWIVFLNKTLDRKTSMNEDQIRIAAQEILQTYGFNKISDLTIIFKRILHGYYDLYDGLTLDRLLKIIRMYSEDRMNAAYDINKRRHEEFKANQPDAPRSSKNKY